MLEPEQQYREEIAEQDSYIDQCNDEIESLAEELVLSLQKIKQ